MGLPPEKAVMSVEEFLAWENSQPDKHEFVAGVTLLGDIAGFD